MSHFFIDDYKFVEWWNKRVNKEEKPRKWIMIIQDQILHILVLIPLILMP